MPIHTFNTLNQPGIFTSATEAFGINDVGQIVGQYSDLGGTHGFLLSGRTYTTLDDPLATGDTFAYGINATGQIAGGYSNATGSHGFLLSSGTYTTLDDPFVTHAHPLPTICHTFPFVLNDSGQIGGAYKNAGGYHGFFYVNRLYAPIDDPFATSGTLANGINAAGQIVGYYVNATGQHGFLLSG